VDLATIKAGLDLAKAVKDWVPKNRDDKALQDQICAALRTFYFTPRGVVALLRKIDLGEKVSEEELSKALLEFNDGEPAVARASELLAFERLENELGISLRTVQTLELLRYGKLSLRRDIQNEINYYGRGRVKPNREKIKELLAQIDKLNSVILEAEEVVGSGGKRAK
jgi:hypothetical protein